MRKALVVACPCTLAETEKLGRKGTLRARFRLLRSTPGGSGPLIRPSRALCCSELQLLTALHPSQSPRSATADTPSTAARAAPAAAPPPSPPTPSPASPADADADANPQAAAYDPVTGEINWDCPCLGGMADGPCGEEFKAAFACFVYSEQEPKGVDCVEKFRGMQECFRKYPEIYGPGESSFLLLDRDGD